MAQISVWLYVVGYFSHSLQGQFVCTGCILFEYSLIHARKGTSGTRVLTQNVPVSTF